MLSLLAFSGAMLVGCYLAGCIPLAFHLSEAKLKLITVFGAGLLVGTALSVIIPEGVHAMYSVSNTHQHQTPLSSTGDVAPVHPHNNAEEVNVKLSASRRLLQAEVAQDRAVIPVAPQHSPNDAAPPPHKNSLEEVVVPQHHHPLGPGDSGGNHQDTGGASTGDHHQHKDHVHQLIGLALVLGFVGMLLIDQIAGHSTDQLSEAESGGNQRKKKLTATIGLVVHAAADGVALGATSISSQLDITIIVFVAIMLHKAPAAFGLTSFLLHDGWERFRIRRHLLIFSLAAPLAAVLTYICMSVQSTDSLREGHTTGFALLLSAGTFLYVATVHVLPEIKNSPSSNQQNSSGGFTLVQLVLVCLGATLPLVLSLTHSH